MYARLKSILATATSRPVAPEPHPGGGSGGEAGAAITLSRRRLFMLPTRAGGLFTAVLAALWLAALNYGNGLAYGLCFLLVAVALVSMLYTDRNLLGLRVQAGTTPPVFAGEIARFAIELIDTAGLPRQAVLIEQDGRRLARVHVPAGGRVTLRLEHPAPHRGWLACPPFRLATCFPFGIFYCWSRPLVLPAARCLVYPRPAPRSQMPVAWAVAADPVPAATHQRRSSRGGEDFAGVRAYTTGDSPRHVHWKAVARGGEWLTKEFAEGAQRRARLVFDYEALEGLGGVEERLSVLCRLVLDADAAGLEYGLRLPGMGEIRPGRGAAHRHDCLERLALFPPATASEGGQL